MNILIFNCGSSSLNYKLYTFRDGISIDTLAWGKAHRVGVRGTTDPFVEHHRPDDTIRQVIPIPTHRRAAQVVLEYLGVQELQIDVVGHRFVHGGLEFHESVWLDPEALAALERCRSLAPIHNPNSMSVIKVVSRLLPHARQFAAFDTAFHATMPPEAFTYALPYDLAERHGLRKYGFHGLSYQDVSLKTSQYLGNAAKELRMVVCHLGTGGSSVAAIRGGRSIDTTMGYSPLPGLVMSTRTGDVDPMIPLSLIEQHNLSVSEVIHLLNDQSGLLGISGLSSDIRDLLEEAKTRNARRAQLAVDVYFHRLKASIASMIAALAGIDVLVFTDGVGLHCPQVREKCCQGLAWCGVGLDRECNRSVSGEIIARISPPGSPVAVLVVPNDEERVIAMEGVRLSGLAKRKAKTGPEKE